jgi:hypothetical protein
VVNVFTQFDMGLYLTTYSANLMVTGGYIGEPKPLLSFILNVPSNIRKSVSVKIITARFRTGTIYKFETFCRKTIYGTLLSSAIESTLGKLFDNIN